MSKPSKKELEKKVTTILSKMFTHHGKSATVEIKKHIKAAGKLLVKKFSKALKRTDKKEKQAKAKSAVKKTGNPGKGTTKR